jgi:hypothetical protein
MRSIAARLAVGVIATTCAFSARADLASVPASRDATLLEDAEGGRANGAGPVFFIGRNNAEEDSIRRALLAFDVAEAIPAGARVTRVELELELTPSNPDVFEIALHRVLAPWSEGPSSASGGGGAPSQAGDATWLHTDYDGEFWDRPGGDFGAVASAWATVDAPGPTVWESTPELVQDVQGWLDAPDANHGWILIGGEFEPQTAKSFASRESATAEARPRLLVEYEASCDVLDLGPGALGLCRAYCEALACAGDGPRGSATACAHLALGFARRTGAPVPCAPPDPGP